MSPRPASLLRVAEFDGLGRAGFGKELWKRGLLGTAVEVGTHRAVFANSLLKTWRGKQLVCVDPWVHYDDHDPASVGNRNRDMEVATRTLSKYGKRAVVMRLFSEMAATLFADNFLDFVYVDANHNREYVEQDLRLWWPKVKPGGLLAGHDILCPAEPDGGWANNIQPTVLEFAVEKAVDVWLVPETTSSPWSYFMVKK